MRPVSCIALCALSTMLAIGCAAPPETPAETPPESPTESLTITTQQVIDALQLELMDDEACPGYFRFTYESSVKAEVDKDRSAASLIYYLMTPEAPIDPWHILTSDEILLYHAGAPMIQMLLYPDGTWEEIVLGPEVEKGHVTQQVIPANTWMGFVKMDHPSYEWGLFGVMVVPAWHAEDIRTVTEDSELAELASQYPDAVTRGRELGLF